MKFSGSLLQSKSIGERFFYNSLNKVNSLLSSIFGLDFSGEKGIKINKNIDEYNYSVSFILDGHEINAVFEYEVEDYQNNILSEVLTIIENDVEITSFENGCSHDQLQDRFLSCVHEIQKYLENKYEIDFTPLIPGENDPKIVSTNCNINDLTWESIFTQDHLDGQFIIHYKFLDNPTESYKTIIKRCHKIILD